MSLIRRWEAGGLALLLLLAGCASLPKDPQREPSRAWDRPLETRLGRAITPAMEQHPGMSGFHVLANGMDAFVARMAIAEAAERTLDLQYYIFHGDLTGKLILDSLLRAADRGVRVRLLIDDTAAKGRDDEIAALATHPYIEVRLFNPAAGRSGISWTFSAAGDFDRINRRMHNKLFAVDNQAGIVGGRNIGDEYFGAREEVNFADLDLLAVGPVVQDLSRTFDGYWNSAWAYPIEALYGITPEKDVISSLRNGLASHMVAARDSEYARRVRGSDLLQRLLDRDLPLVWAPAQVVSDEPEKVAGAGQAADAVKMVSRLRPLVEAARGEVILSSPYFIPGKEGIGFFDGLRQKGVRVRIVTNSLAGNDVAAVHGGYSKYRKDLLRLGVELYELKPSPGATEDVQAKFGSSGASLHAKSFIIDRERVFVGSLNMDPRSRDLNTELGIVVDSRELAEMLARQFEGLVQPLYSFRLSLDPSDGDIVWTGEEQGKEVSYRRDPGAGWWRRFSVWFLSLFTPESLL